MLSITIFFVSCVFTECITQKNIKEFGLSSSRKAITALLMARDPARMVRSFC